MKKDGKNVNNQLNHLPQIAKSLERIANSLVGIEKALGELGRVKNVADVAAELGMDSFKPQKKGGRK